jgi:hypothetical protein
MSEIAKHDQGALPEEEGDLQMRQLGPNVLLFQVSGHLSVAVANTMIERAERLIGEVGRVHAFHDWEHVTGYDNASRLELTGFMFTSRQSFASAHLLVKEQLVAFGVEVANIVLTNKINVHSERASFKKALEGASAASRGDVG